jgi:hypothetical protein
LYLLFNDDFSRIHLDIFQDLFTWIDKKMVILRPQKEDVYNHREFELPTVDESALLTSVLLSTN